MSKKYKLAIVAGVALLLAVVLLAGQALAQTGTQTPVATVTGTPTPGGMTGGSGMMGGTAMPGGMMGGTAMPGGMMGGAGMMGSATTTTGTVPYDAHGMMGMMMSMMGNMMGGAQGAPYGMGSAMMGMMGQGMMGGWSDPNAKPLTLDQAQAAALKYIQSLPNNVGVNLAPVEVMEFANGFYVAVGDKSTSAGAFEILVDRYNGNVTPEPGPNMMWNTKYGMMSGQQGGMMGMMGGMMGLWTPNQGTPTVTAQQAQTYAEQFLAIKFPTAKLPQDLISFPGYYTLDFEVNGQPAGMLSVNAYTGQVWYHTWHGQFLSESSTSAS
jgi:hypothetical protein